MARKVSDTNELPKPTENVIKLKSGDKSNSNADDPSAHQASNITLAHLEKGLLLFVYVYETAESDLSREMLFWNHRLCPDVIKTGKCTKTPGQCSNEHQTEYRQENLCSQWYAGNRCTFGAKCQNSHKLERVPNEHRYACSESDAETFKLIRFIRNFTGHYIETAINQHPQLYKDVLSVMIYLVHALSRKKPQSVEHLHLFLDKTTINQIFQDEDIIVQLEKPLNVPEAFFASQQNYSATWYRPNANRRAVNFNTLSPGFVAYFSRIFTEYYHGRLKSRGLSAAWS